MGRDLNDEEILKEWLLGQTREQLMAVALRLDIDANSLDINSAYAMALQIWQQVRHDAPGMQRLRDLARPAAAAPAAAKLWAERPHVLAKNFTGQYEQRRALTEWLLAGPHPLLILTGFHGSGKTELAWAWMKRDVMGEPIPDAVRDRETEGIGAGDANLGLIVWWRFTKDPATAFGKFLQQICQRLLRAGMLRDLPGTDDERVTALLDALRSTRILMVLDEFENETLYRPRPVLDVQLDPVEAGARRWRCYDPCAARFLEGVAATVERSRVLVTCPFVPHDLDRVAGCREEPLGKMNRTDALDFFRAQGVEYGYQAKIYAICERFRYHAGSLRDVTTYIAIRGGRPEVAADFRPNETAEAQMFEALSSPARELLKLVSVHQSGFDYTLLETLWRIAPEKGDLGNILEELAGMGILRHEGGSYRLNRRIASYAYRKLVGTDNREPNLETLLAQPESTAKSSAVLLAMLSDPDAEPDFRNEDDLEPLIDIYLRLVTAGAHQQAWDLWKTRLNGYLYYRFGSYYRVIHLLEMLLPKHKQDSVRLPDEDVGWLYNSLANASSLSGQVRKSIDYFDRALEMYKKGDAQVGEATALGNQADDLFKLGRFTEAHASLDRMLDICGQHNEEHLGAYGLQVRATLCTIEGEYDRAAADLDQAFRIFERVQQRRYVGATQALQARLLLCKRDSAAALEKAEAALKNARWKENRRDLVRAHWILGCARIGEFERTGDSGSLDTAYEDLKNALNLVNEISLLEFEPDVYIALAAWAIHMRKLRNAVAWISKASEVVENSEFVLKKCELALMKARIADTEGDKARAGTWARQAFQLAQFEEGRFTYRFVADAARVIEQRCL